jgi:hypothetical protein
MPIIRILLLISFSLSAFAADDRFEPAMSFQIRSAKTELNSRDIDTALALYFDLNLLAKKFIRSGPGIGLLFSLPREHGTEAVNFSPYVTALAVRWNFSFDLVLNRVALRPFFRLEAQAGARFVQRQVWYNISWLYDAYFALGPRLGANIYFDSIGFGFSYAPMATNSRFVESYEISLNMRF